MSENKEKKSKMADEQKIEKIDATAEEIARAIFAAADGVPRPPKQKDDSNPVECDDNECQTDHE